MILSLLCTDDFEVISQKSKEIRIDMFLANQADI